MSATGNAFPPNVAVTNAAGRAPLPLRMVVASISAVALAYLFTFGGNRLASIAAWLMAAGSAGLLSSTLALGAVRRGRNRGAAVAAGLTFAIVFGCYAAALLVPSAAGGRTLLGLPLISAVVVYGIGLLPLPILALTFARTFDERH